MREAMDSSFNVREVLPMATRTKRVDFEHSIGTYYVGTINSPHHDRVGALVEHSAR